MSLLEIREMVEPKNSDIVDRRRHRPCCSGSMTEKAFSSVRGAAAGSGESIGPIEYGKQVESYSAGRVAMWEIGAL